MIGTIDVKVQAHNPNFPLEPVFTFINSAQSFRIRNVPRAIGKWNITKVFIHLNYPDETTISKECVLNGNIWIGTVEGCATSGTSTNGFYVTASGIDENENFITNYVLGAGDLYVKDLDGTIDPERVGTKMYFNDTLPANPKKGDATFIDQTLNVYDGTNWVPVAVNPDPSFIIDADGNKICADRTVEIVEQGEQSWTLTDGTNTYTLTGTKDNATWTDGTNQYDLRLDTNTLWSLKENFYMGGFWITRWTEFLAGNDSDTTLTFPTHGFTATWNDGKQITQDELALKSDLPTKTSDLTNDSGFITSTQVEPYPYVAGYAQKSVTAMTVASRNTRNNGREFPVVLGTSEEGTQPRAILNRYFLPDWNLSQYDQTTYDTPIKLTWQMITLKRKIGPGVATSYQGYGWISEFDDEGRQYAISCANVYGEANPNYFYYDDGTGNFFSVKKAITLSEDGKTITALQGDTTIVCSRTSTIWNSTDTTVANLTDLPTTTSQLTNDSGFITSADLPTKTSDLTNDSGYITSAEIEPYHNIQTPTGNTGLANTAYKLALADHGSFEPVDGGKFYATLDTNRDLTNQFRATMSVTTYWPYVMSKYNGQTLSPELTLYFCKDQLRYGTTRPREYYDGYMFRTAGAGFAIPCSEDGTPDGRLIETIGVEHSYVRMENNTTSIHSIGFSEGSNYNTIITIDGQTDMIYAHRTNAYKMYSFSEEIANKSELPTKTSDLTNDSGFITSADIITKRALSDFNVYVDPMADMTTTKFTVVISYAATPSTPLFTVELTHQGGEETAWAWSPSGSNQRISIDYSSVTGNYGLHYYNLQDGGGNEHSGQMALPIAAPYWTGEAQDDWFHFSVTSQTTTITTKAYVDSLIAQLSARITALENNNQ